MKGYTFTQCIMLSTWVCTRKFTLYCTSYTVQCRVYTSLYCTVNYTVVYFPVQINSLRSFFANFKILEVLIKHQAPLFSCFINFGGTEAPPSLDVNPPMCKCRHAAEHKAHPDCKLVHWGQTTYSSDVLCTMYR